MDINIVNRISNNSEDIETSKLKSLLSGNLRHGKTGHVGKSKTGRVGEKDKKALHEACMGFEAIFMETMLKSMRKTIPQDNLFGDDNGMDIYKSMYDQYLSRDLAEHGGGIGLEDFLYKRIAGSE